MDLRSFRFSPGLVAAVLAAVAGGAAQAELNRWSSIGPESEPGIHSLAVASSSPDTIYAGATGAIWRTEDGGRNWTEASTPDSNACQIRALAIHPTEPSTLYAGCVGVIKSIDSGRTWSLLRTGMEFSQGGFPVVWAIAIDPSSPATLYAGTPMGTLYKSLNGGTTWQQIGSLPNAAREIRALVVDPASSNTVYAGATIGGAFKSLNGGASWASVNTGLPTTSLAIDPRSPTTLYAGTIGSGVFKTTDGASSWVEVFGPRDVGGLLFTVAELAIDPMSPSTLYVAVGDAELDLGIFQTTDGGVSWRPVSDGLPDYPALRALAIAPNSPNTVYSGLLDQFPGYVDGGVFAISLGQRCDPGPAASGILEFPIPTANSEPLGIAAGQDCALWFTESEGNKIGRISLTGEITEFPIPTPSSDPARIVAGPDGALWFTESRGNKIGRITTAGVITEFPIPTPGSFPVGITTGPDGNLWFAEQSGHKIGRITPAGVITEFLVPPRGPFLALPLSITAGPDGNLWFSEYFTGRIGRITTEGSITMFIVAPDCCASLGEITAGPDGNLWFAEEWDDKIGRITPAGSLEYFPVGTVEGAQYTVYGIAAGPDGALWFTHLSGWIGRITTGGIVSRFSLPSPDALPEIITAGPDGNMWFTEMRANKIGRIAVPVSSPRRRSVRRD